MRRIDLAGKAWTLLELREEMVRDPSSYTKRLLEMSENGLLDEAHKSGGEIVVPISGCTDWNIGVTSDEEQS